jgi:hypothetical protein
MAKQKIPTYTVYIVSGNTKYNVTPAVVGFDRSEDNKQIAQCVTLQLTNVQVKDKALSALLNPGSRVYMYANDGNQNEEIFRGFLWKRNGKASLSDRELQYKCYDHLIYLQESDDSVYFSTGKSTKDVFASLCDKWGIKLNYIYDSITHAKLVLRGKLSDIFTADLLDLVKERTGKKYVVLSDKDTMHIKPVGSNETIYHFTAGNNVIYTSSGWTMDGMITKVIVVGKADSEDREPIEATLSGNTETYGTLQKIYDRDENTSLADAKLEAKSIIDENGEPKWEYEIKAPDIPWIRKGDKVFVNAGDISERFLIVSAVDRSFDTKKNDMVLNLEEE